MRRAPSGTSFGEKGGWGGNARTDGENALVNVVLGDMRNFPVELLESKNPIRIRRYELVGDSGGPGQRRGGLSTVRDIEIQADDVVLSLWFERSRTPAWGLFGGRAGRPPRVVVNPGRPDERTLLKVSTLPIARGTVTSAFPGGGGGYGEPFARDPRLVREDVIDGYVSREGAERDYGVVLKPGPYDVDEAATGVRRSVGAHPQV